ncbi:MAG: hypothetical protein GEU81_05810 [Nitriliruptorales bacterium]|nr:hypothetical protein [Nitriliruptorales bacterium]
MPPGDEHRRPDGVDDATVEAVGMLSEALEWVERARGSLYTFHQLSGHADLLLGDAADALEEAGHADFAERLRCELVGRNVISGRWTFQVVEDYDDGYYAAFRDFDRQASERFTGGIRHLYEAEMKERRRTHGRPGHESRPQEISERA